MVKANRREGVFVRASRGSAAAAGNSFERAHDHYDLGVRKSTKQALCASTIMTAGRGYL